MGLIGADGGQRRRRVLAEQMKSTASAPADREAAPEADAPRTTYAEQTFAAQPSLTSFVALRYSTIALWFVAASLVVVALETAYVHLADLQVIAPAKSLAAFDLAAPGSLKDWYCSLLLALACAGSLAIYSFRRHKVDDYSGRYLVWLWAALGWLVLSADATAGFHRAIGPIAAHLTGMSNEAGGAWWWLAPAAILYGALGLRLALDLRGCRLALAALVLAFGCWGVVLAARLGGVPLDDGRLAVVVQTSAVMAAQVLLLTALALYARYVVLDAHGAVRPRATKPKRAKQPRKKATTALPEAAAAEAPAKPQRVARIDPPHAHPPQPVVSSATEPAPRPAETVAADWDVEDDGAPRRKLSKAERRRQRKEARTRAEGPVGDLP